VNRGENIIGKFVILDTFRRVSDNVACSAITIAMSPSVSLQQIHDAQGSDVKLMIGNTSLQRIHDEIIN